MAKLIDWIFGGTETENNIEAKACTKYICKNAGGCKKFHESGDCSGAYFDDKHKYEWCCKGSIEKFSNIKSSDIGNIALLCLLLFLVFFYLKKK